LEESGFANRDALSDSFANRGFVDGTLPVVLLGGRRARRSAAREGCALRSLRSVTTAMEIFDLQHPDTQI